MPFQEQPGTLFQPYPLAPAAGSDAAACGALVGQHDGGRAGLFFGPRMVWLREAALQERVFDKLIGGCIPWSVHLVSFPAEAFRRRGLTDSEGASTGPVAFFFHDLSTQATAG